MKPRKTPNILSKRTNGIHKSAANTGNGRKYKFSTIESAVADFKKGKCIIVIDDEDRENEGDLIYSAQKSTPALVNFLIKHTSGVICVPMEESRLKDLKLNMMTAHNTALHETAFTISVDYVHGTSTGISASDRN